MGAVAGAIVNMAHLIKVSDDFSHFIDKSLARPSTAIPTPLQDGSSFPGERAGRTHINPGNSREWDLRIVIEDQGSGPATLPRLKCRQRIFQHADQLLYVAIHACVSWSVLVSF
jgi:hypothetical protein